VNLRHFLKKTNRSSKGFKLKGIYTINISIYFITLQEILKNNEFLIQTACLSLLICKAMYNNQNHIYYSLCFKPLQDFEALTPNLLARTIETIEGGGIVCVLLQNMSSLKKLYTMTMVCTNF